MKKPVLITGIAVACIALVAVALHLHRAFLVADVISDEARQDALSEAIDNEYDGLVDFLREGFKEHWADTSPEDKDLSPVWNHCSEAASYAEHDINGDGVRELVLADDFGEGNYCIYDIFTFDEGTQSLIHLAKGGERDRFLLNSDGVIIENGSNSAFDSFQRGFVIEGGKLARIKGASWHEDLLVLDFKRIQENVEE